MSHDDQGRFSVTPPRRVLVIDGGSETDTVLRAVLEPRGAQVRRARSHCLDAAPQSEDRPDVVVIDLDHASEAAADFARGAQFQVLLSSQRIDVAESHARFLEKPFQFPELIRAVEELLACRPAA